MIDHVSLSVSDFARSHAFYDAALAPLGMAVRMGGGGQPYAGYGKDRPVFWIAQGGSASGPTHVAFTAPTPAEVDAFHTAALTAGGKDNGAPGIRAQYAPTYYGAFVLDPDGNNIEAVCQAPG